MTKVDEYMGILNKAPPEIYRAFTAEAFAYFGLTSGNISVIENDLSPHRIRTPAIRIGNLLYEGPERIGQIIVLTQRRYIKDLLAEGLEASLQ